MCSTVAAMYSAEDWIQGFLHTRHALSHLRYIFSSKMLQLGCRHVISSGDYAVACIRSSSVSKRLLSEEIKYSQETVNQSMLIRIIEAIPWSCLRVKDKERRG